MTARMAILLTLHARSAPSLLAILFLQPLG
jgi:hypothetical protein